MTKLWIQMYITTADAERTVRNELFGLLIPRYLHSSKKEVHTKISAYQQERKFIPRYLHTSKNKKSSYQDINEPFRAMKVHPKVSNTSS